MGQARASDAGPPILPALGGPAAATAALSHPTIAGKPCFPGEHECRINTKNPREAVDEHPRHDLPALARPADRPVPAHHGLRLLEAGPRDREAVFHLYFREHPFGGGFTVACGLEHGASSSSSASASSRTTSAYLAGLKGNDGRPLFERAFLDYLGRLRAGLRRGRRARGHGRLPAGAAGARRRARCSSASCWRRPLLNIDQLPDAGRHQGGPHRARPPGASRCWSSACAGPRGSTAALSASRAAYVGGCAATSNVLAGRLFGIPVKGTHAHSWVMCFDDELEAFEAYAEAMPNNCVFLVDTYDTLEGVRHAVEVGRRLRRPGHELAGHPPGFGRPGLPEHRGPQDPRRGRLPDAAIVASNDLDEHIIASLKEQGAKIDVWGVGTRLVTGYDEPALGGVYKLSAVRRPGGPWQDRVKLSEQAIKISTPGVLQVRRFRDRRPGDRRRDLRP